MLDFNKAGPYMTVDLHGMTVAEARAFLEHKLSSAGREVMEIEVIHGYTGGTALKNMVRNFKHPRVKSKILGLNQGSTTLVLK